jgi:hypothetical protein
MNKLGQYDDGRSNYNFSFSDNDGKHISVSFRAEPDYDLDIIFNEFRNFLIATNHDIEGQIGELGIDESEQDDDDDESYPQSWGKEADDILLESIDAMTQAQSSDKFSMDHLPNNGWPFGGLTTSSIPALTKEQIAALFGGLTTSSIPAFTKEQIAALTVKSIDLSQVNQYPTMSPITSEQIKSWKFDAPGTIGGIKVSYK